MGGVYRRTFEAILSGIEGATRAFAFFDQDCGSRQSQRWDWSHRSQPGRTKVQPEVRKAVEQVRDEITV